MRLIIFTVIILASSIGMWIRKLVLKKRLQDGLGRKVEDRELTSISSWMNAQEKNRS